MLLPLIAHQRRTGSPDLTFGSQYVHVFKLLIHKKHPDKCILNLFSLLKMPTEVENPNAG